MLPLHEHTTEQLNNVIANHKRHGKLSEPYAVAAMEELARRIGKGLDFDKSRGLILRAAREGRYLSYKELADESGTVWSKVRYAMNGHLGDLIRYAHSRGWPLLSAIVVNQDNVATGKMEPTTLKGFVEAAKELGFAVADDEAFLVEQQRRVFDWAKRGE